MTNMTTSTVENDITVDVEERKEQIIHALSANQERNLLDYIENEFLEISRAYKKRYVSYLQIVY